MSSCKQVKLSFRELLLLDLAFELNIDYGNIKSIPQCCGSIEYVWSKQYFLFRSMNFVEALILKAYFRSFINIKDLNLEPKSISLHSYSSWACLGWYWVILFDGKVKSPLRKKNLPKEIVHPASNLSFNVDFLPNQTLWHRPTFRRW